MNADRAPIDKEGLVPFCRDSFFAETTLRLWKTTSARGKELLVEATSETGVVEVNFYFDNVVSNVPQVGGGPWWSPWSESANMTEPLRMLCRLPIDTGELSKILPGPLKPPGL